MKITDIRIRRVFNQDRLLAIVSVAFDSEMVIHDIKIIRGADRRFVAMPSRERYLSQDAPPPDQSSKFVDIAHPISKEFREYLEKEILCAYQHYLDSKSQEREPISD